mgnify:CR=1 FL=1
MKVNPVSNWIMGSKNNIEYLCKNIKLKVVNAYADGSANEYTNYTLKAVGNYIRLSIKMHLQVGLNLGRLNARILNCLRIEQTMKSIMR